LPIAASCACGVGHILNAAVEPWLSGSPHLFARGVGNSSDDSIGSQSGSSESCDIVVTGHSGPVPGEHSLTVLVDFAEGDGAHSRSFQSKREPANA
jgi:hypothetical protein